MGLLFFCGEVYQRFRKQVETSLDKRHHHAKAGRAINAAQRRK